MARVTVLFTGQLVPRYQQTLPQFHIHHVRRGFAQRTLLHVLADGTGQVRAAGHVVEVLRLHLLLISLTVIEIVEVGDDDRHWQRYGQHTCDCAQGPHDLAPDSYGPAGR